jgi:hypothetical protein
MQSLIDSRLRTLLWWAVCLLLLKVTAGIVLQYGEYFPPDFASDFLFGRDAYFFGVYQWAFYTHIVSGPCALVLGLLLLSNGLRSRFPGWHRRLGRVQVASILLLMVPSGLWMACFAQTGAVAGVGFAALALATGLCVWSGWRSAVRLEFAEHRLWMCRCFLLLSSAVVLRLTAGVFTVMRIDGEWTYAMAAWTSWLIPLGVFELVRRRQASATREPNSLQGHVSPSP